MNNSISLLDGPIGGRLIQLAVPILCANVLQYINGTVSAFWVGRFLGEAALTALANAQLTMFLLTGATFAIAMAASILVGQCMGGDNVAGAKRIVGTGVAFFSGLSLSLTVLGLILTKSLLIWMDTPPEALTLAVPYMRLMLLAMPCMYLLGFVSALLVGIGDSKTPLKFVVLSVSLGAFLTPAFVLGGHAMMGAGVVGAALATVAAQTLCMITLLHHLHRRRHPLWLTRKDVAVFRVDWHIVRALLRLGIPMGAQSVVVSLSSVLMISLVNRFGVETTAAYGALLQLWTYILIPALAFSTAASTMAAQNVGAQNWIRVRRIARVGMVYGLAATAAGVAVVYAAGGHAYRFLLPNGSPALEIASHVNGIVTWSLVLMSIPLVLFGVMRAAGAVMVPLLLHILSLLIVRYLLAAFLLDRWQADAIWWSLAISAMVDVVLAMFYYRYGRWQRADRVPSGGRVPAVHAPTAGDL